MSAPSAIALLGPRAAGKSSIGPLLARALGLPFLDLDRELEREHARSCAELLRERGEAAFRELERASLTRVSAGAPHVLATGGGVVVTAAARELLRARYRCFAVLAPSAVLAARLRADGGAATRPALRGGDPADEVEALLRERLPHYLALAEGLWSSDRASAEEIAEEMAICAARGAPRAASAAPPPKRLKLEIEPAAERAVKRGHPWVFRERIRAQSRAGETGELAVVFDRARRFLAIGLYDAHSPIALRVLHSGRARTIDAAFFCEWLRAALSARDGLFDERETNAYRLVHGESDAFPGLVLDRYGERAVLKIYSAVWKPFLPLLSSLIAEELRPQALILRTSRNLGDAALAARDGEALIGERPAGPVEFREHGLRFEADLVRGQKTGFFLDQRENRARVGELARDRAVLNLFSHAGGFSVHAAAGGARGCLDVDQSAHALASAQRNFARNADHPRVRAARHEMCQADVFAWLREAPPRSFELVVVDPPTLARRAEEKEGALRAYERLITGALARTAKGGILVAASCTAQVPAEEFFALVRGTAQRSGRAFRELAATEHPADHPARIREARYLKCLYLALGDPRSLR